MIDPSKFRDIKPLARTDMPTATLVQAGIPIPKAKRVQQFSPAEWEEFTEEWASSKKSEYHRIVRLGGSGDMGLDVVAFVTNSAFSGGWDNFQCKHYEKALTPADITIEIAKIIYYSFNGEYPPPRKYFFVAPRGAGTKLSKLLADEKKLKDEVKNNWPTQCAEKIKANQKITLSGDIEAYFDLFDFSIFSSCSPVELVEEHASTPFHAVRFGGGSRAA
jgi:hypothetical protein